MKYSKYYKTILESSNQWMFDNSEIFINPNRKELRELDSSSEAVGAIILNDKEVLVFNRLSALHVGIIKALNLSPSLLCLNLWIKGTNVEVEVTDTGKYWYNHLKEAKKIISNNEYLNSLGKITFKKIFKNSSFLDSFIVNRQGHEILAEVFTNPNSRELNYITQENSFGAIILDNGDVLGFDHYKILHNDIIQHLKLNGSNFIPLNVYYGGGECLVNVTDSIRSSSIDKKDVAEALRNNFYLDKLSSGDLEISYYNEDVVGDWEE